MAQEENGDNISAYFSKGQELLGMNRFQEAIGIFNESIILCKRKGDHDCLSSAYYYLGISYKNIDKKEESFENLYKSIELGIETSNWKNVDKAFMEIIDLGFDKKKTGHYNLILKRYFERGNSFLLNGKYKESLEPYTMLINKGILLESWELVAKGYINMGFILIDLGKSNDAISILEKAIYYSEKANYTEGIGNAYLNQSIR